MRNSWRWGPVTKPLIDAGCLEQLAQFKRLFVGFSGGLDSTVLLHNLALQPSLAKKLIAIHINHGLSINAFAWQTHCQQLCEHLAIPLIIKAVNFERQANIEAEARKARYEVFASLLEQEDCLILAHHLDDQAETLLLQLFRGAGIDGLAAMTGQRPFAKGQLVRPFLALSRSSLELYAQAQQLEWIEDESNQDPGFSRNFLRQALIPLIQTRWPAVNQNLARTAEHCQQARENLDDLAKIDCPELSENKNTLSLGAIRHLSWSRLTNILRLWLRMNQQKLPNTLTFNRLIEEVIHAEKDSEPLVCWDKICIRRYKQTLYLLKQQTEFLTREVLWFSFPEPLYLQGLGYLKAISAKEGLVIEPGSKLEVRFRQGGEFFNWHGQRKQLKKLFQEWQIPVWLREQTPLLYVNEQLAAVAGYAVSDHFYQKASQAAYWLSLESDY